MPSENPNEQKSANHTDPKPSDKGDPAPEFPPPASIPPVEVPPAPHGYQITCKTEKDWRDKVKFWAELFGLALLLAYTIFTALMYRANKEAADAASQALKDNTNAFKIDEQARIRVTNREAGWDIRLPVPRLAATYQYTNVGKTPAETIGIDKHVSLIAFRPDVDSLTFPATLPQKIVTRDTISNGDDRVLSVFNDSFPVKDFQDQVLNQKMLIVAWGCIEYRDIFEDLHWVDFRDVRQPAPNDKTYAVCSYRCEREKQ